MRADSETQPGTRTQYEAPRRRHAAAAKGARNAANGQESEEGSPITQQCFFSILRETSPTVVPLGT